jgi:hypothetical protein
MKIYNGCICVWKKVRDVGALTHTHIHAQSVTVTEREKETLASQC